MPQVLLVNASSPLVISASQIGSALAIANMQYSYFTGVSKAMVWGGDDVVKVSRNLYNTMLNFSWASTAVLRRT